MDIRLMTIDDYEQVIAVWTAAGLTVDPVLDSKDALATVLAMNPTSCFVMCHDDKVIGAVLGTYNGRVGWIYHLGVLPEYQNHGIGTRLLAVAEHALKQLGAPMVYLSVKVGTEALLPFYKNRGYGGFSSLVLQKAIFAVPSIENTAALL